MIQEETRYTQEDGMPVAEPSMSSIWPDHPSPLRKKLTDFSRAYRVAQRLFEVYGEPVAILELASPVQSHSVVWGPKIYSLKLHHAQPHYKLVTTVF